MTERSERAIKLQPCPFCGGNELRFADSDIEGWISHVECMDCDDMLGPMSEFKYDDVEEARVDASNVWNRRAAPSVQPEDAAETYPFSETDLAAPKNGQPVAWVRTQTLEWFASGPSGAKADVSSVDVAIRQHGEYTAPLYSASAGDVIERCAQIADEWRFSK